jgi:hypothetical protein
LEDASPRGLPNLVIPLVGERLPPKYANCARSVERQSITFFMDPYRFETQWMERQRKREAGKIIKNLMCADQQVT